MSLPRKSGRYTPPRAKRPSCPASRDKREGRPVGTRRMRVVGWALVLASPSLVRIGPTVGFLLAAAVALGGAWLVRQSRPPGRAGWARRASTSSVLTAPWAAKFWPRVDACRDIDRQRGRLPWGAPAAVGMVLGGMWPMLVATGFYGALGYGIAPGVLARCLLGALAGVALVTVARAAAERHLPVLPRLARVSLRAALVVMSSGAVLASTAMANEAGKQLRRPGVYSVGARSMAPVLLPSAGRVLRAEPAPFERLVALLGSVEAAQDSREEVSLLLSHDLWLVDSQPGNRLWSLFDRTIGETVTISPLLLRVTD